LHAWVDNDRVIILKNNPSWNAWRYLQGYKMFFNSKLITRGIQEKYLLEKISEKKNIEEKNHY